MNAPNRYAWLAGLFLLTPVTYVHSEEPVTGSKEVAFVDGGRINIQLSAGEHTISESDDNTIRMSWHTEDKDVHDVEAHAEIDGSKAKIDIDGPKKNFRAVIKVPRHSDLVVRVSAGELEVGPIVGDKDIRLRAGELSIEVGKADEYGLVKGSLWAGDIDAGPFSMEESGLFRSIEWKGNGDHSLLFKLYAGDVTLYQPGN